MKILLAAMLLAVIDQAAAIGGGSGGVYECKMDPRGVVVCYPKPRGF